MGMGMETHSFNHYDFADTLFGTDSAVADAHAWSI